MCSRAAARPSIVHYPLFLGKEARAELKAESAQFLILMQGADPVL